MNENSFNNIADFENEYELRKALNKLESELHKKDYELTAITNLYQDLKSLNERIKKESNNLTERLGTEKNEKIIMEKKYQNEISAMKAKHDRDVEIYEKKLLKLSEYNPNDLRKNIEIQMEAKFKQELLNKDKEINELTEELNQYKQRNELLLTEYETYKNDITNEINVQRQLHQSEVNSLLDKIKIGENFKKFEDDQGDAPETIMQIKNELDSTRRNITELNNEIDKLRHDKELLTIEKNEYKLNLVKIRDSQNFNQKKLEAEVNKNQNIIENMQREINELKNLLKDKEYQINDLLKQKETLNERIYNYDLDYQELQNMIHSLKGMIQTKEEDNNNIIIEQEKANKEMFMKERKEKEQYQKQIEELNIKLREAKSDDMIKKENEINKLKEEIRIYKKENQYDSNSKPYKELLIKLKNMTDKKNEYKLQCKIANENMDAIINKLSKEQQKELAIIIQNTNNKYMKNKKLSVSGNDKSFN